MQAKRNNVVTFKLNQNKPYVGTAKIMRVYRAKFGSNVNRLGSPHYSAKLIGVGEAETGSEFCLFDTEITSVMTERKWKSL